MAPSPYRTVPPPAGAVPGCTGAISDPSAALLTCGRPPPCPVRCQGRQGRGVRDQRLPNPGWGSGHLRARGHFRACVPANQLTDFPGLSMTVPGMVGLSPGNTGLAGGTYFTAPGVFVQNILRHPLCGRFVHQFVHPAQRPGPDAAILLQRVLPGLPALHPRGLSEPGQHRGLRLWRAREFGR